VEAGPAPLRGLRIERQERIHDNISRRRSVEIHLLPGRGPVEKGFRLGRFVVWPPRGRIEGPDGTVHVTPKSMAVIECLARAEGDVVARNDILDTVWPGADVTDDVLTHSVTELRRAFGDSPQQPRFIETIPKKGLRLVVAVEWLGDGSAAASRAKTRLRLVAVMAIVVAASAAIVGVLAWDSLNNRQVGLRGEVERSVTSILVTAFADHSPQQGYQYLADGVAAEIRVRLSRVEDLVVLGAFSSVEAAPDYILNGSVQRSGDNLRVTIELCNAIDGSQVWTHRYDGEFTDVFDIQDRIANGVALALSVKLDVAADPVGIYGTENPDAYEELLRGNGLFDFNPANMRQAARHYAQAAALDPEFVAAWLRLAMIYEVTWGDWSEMDAAEQRRTAESAMERALMLAPDSADVLLVAAGMSLSQERWFEARRYYDRAIERGAIREFETFAQIRRAHIHFGMIYMPGYVDDMVRLLERVYRLEPLRGTYGQFLPQAYLAAGRLQEALAEAERSSEHPFGRTYSLFVGLSVALAINDTELIQHWLQRLIGEPVFSHQDIIRKMDEVFGDRDASLAFLRDAFESRPKDDYAVMQWAGYYGDDELVLKAMRRSGNLWSFWTPLHAGVRQTDEFKEIVQDMGLVEYWREFGWPDFCRPVGNSDFECH
jgi:DNA-binding winged helix-turn-helix (wHTH) protein/TolB-like protein